MARIDLRSHILSSIDYGPASDEESLEMARIASKDGTEVIVATPHFRDVELHSTSRAVYEAVAGLDARLQRMAEDRERTARLMVGMEHRIEPRLPGWIDEGKALTLANTKFLLVTLPFKSYPDFVDDVLSRIRAKRLTPLIAHPERNETLQKRPKLLRRIVDDGALTLSTASSFTGGYGPAARKAAEKFLRRRLLHAVASDMHGTDGVRSPLLSPAFDRISELAGQRAAHSLFETNPALILQGHTPDPAIARKGRRNFLAAGPLRQLFPSPPQSAE